jgi:hypothetical protein
LLSAGENPSLDECLETAVTLVDLALTIKYLYFPVSGASDHRMPQWSMRLNSLLCFALAICYSISSGVLSDCDTTEALKSALDQFCIFATKKAETLGIELDGDMRVFLSSQNRTAGTHVSKGSCGEFVEKFCPVIPDQFDNLQNPLQYLVKSHAEIIRPSESSDHGVVQDFDCRLPFRMQLDLLLNNTLTPLPRFRGPISLFLTVRSLICVFWQAIHLHNLSRRLFSSSSFFSERTCGLGYSAGQRSTDFRSEQSDRFAAKHKEFEHITV